MGTARKRNELASSSDVETITKDFTYFATLRLEHGGKTVDVDLRPSDALVMAHIADVPFYVPSDIMTALWGETIDPRGWGSPAQAERPTGIQEGWS